MSIGSYGRSLGDDPSPVMRQHWLEMMECLLEAGADPSAGHHRETPLVYSRLYDLQDIEAILEQYIVRAESKNLIDKLTLEK